jgi:hypothetical protein
MDYTLTSLDKYLSVLVNGDVLSAAPSDRFHSDLQGRRRRDMFFDGAARDESTSLETDP